MTPEEIVKEMVDEAEKRKWQVCPEDDIIQVMCEHYGYGAVMTVASKLWLRKDPKGAFLVGPCALTVQKSLEEVSA